MKPRPRGAPLPGRVGDPPRTGARPRAPGRPESAWPWRSSSARSKTSRSAETWRAGSLAAETRERDTRILSSEGCRAGSASGWVEQAAHRDRHRGRPGAHCSLDKPWLRTDGGSGARPGRGQGGPQGPSVSSARPAGRACAACFTGSLVHRAERWVGWEPPAPPPTPEGVSVHSPVQGPSVLGFHTIAVTWEILEDPADPHFSCTPRTVATASTILRGGTPPATPPHTLLLRLASAWVPGWPRGHSARGRPLPGVRTVTRLLLPLTSFSSQVWTDAKQEPPATAGRAAPHGGRPRILGSCGGLLGRPASLPHTRLSTVACVPGCPHVGLSDRPWHGQWAARSVHSLLVDTGWPPHRSCCVP